MDMKIGIDIRCLTEGRRTGVEEYAINLLDNLFQKDKNNEYILFFNSFRNNRVDLSWTRKYSNVKVKIFFFPNKILNFMFWYLGWPHIDKMIGGVDVFFSPNINFVSVSKKTKLLVTFHDLSFEIFPETFSLKRRMWHMFVNPKKLAKKAHKIVAVSSSTRDDLVNYYGIEDEKINVIHNGISNDFGFINRNDPKLLAVKEKYDLPFNFILYFGTIEPRKNIVGIVRSFNYLRGLGNKKVNRFKLVIAGESGWKAREIYDEIRKSKYREDIIVINSVQNEDKPFLYSLASVFVYPSFFEGFGFPPLEAMSSGIPVIVSNNSSMPETVGASAIMVDSDRLDEIALAIKELIINGNLRRKMQDRGAIQVRNFNWKKTAQEFFRVLKEME